MLCHNEIIGLSYCCLVHFICCFSCNSVFFALFPNIDQKKGPGQTTISHGFKIEQFKKRNLNNLSQKGTLPKPDAMGDPDTPSLSRQSCVKHEILSIDLHPLKLGRTVQVCFEFSLRSGLIFSTNHVNYPSSLILHVLPFSRHMNRYFLLIACLQLFHEITPVHPASTWVPLIIVLALSAAKEGFDDVKRARRDREVNNARVTVISNGQLREVWVTFDHFPHNNLNIWCFTGSIMRHSCWSVGAIG